MRFAEDGDVTHCRELGIPLTAYWRQAYHEVERLVALAELVRLQHLEREKWLNPGEQMHLQLLQCICQNPQQMRAIALRWLPHFAQQSVKADLMLEAIKGVALWCGLPPDTDVEKVIEALSSRQ